MALAVQARVGRVSRSDVSEPTGLLTPFTDLAHTFGYNDLAAVMVDFAAETMVLLTTTYDTSPPYNLTRAPLGGGPLSFVFGPMPSTLTVPAGVAFGSVASTTMFVIENDQYQNEYQYNTWVALYNWTANSTAPVSPKIPVYNAFIGGLVLTADQQTLYYCRRGPPGPAAVLRTMSDAMTPRGSSFALSFA
jgi:hypothetical protein